MDVITYCTDTNAFVIEIKAKYPDMVTENDQVILSKTPVVHHESNSMTLALCRVDDALFELLNGLESIEVLGTYEEVFEDEELKVKYDSVYVREYSYTDENGDVVAMLRPEKFGVIL